MIRILQINCLSPTSRNKNITEGPNSPHRPSLLSFTTEKAKYSNVKAL